MIYSTQEYFLNPYIDAMGKVHKMDNASERFHEIEIEHFSVKKDRRVKLSDSERAELKKMMLNFPNKNHTPVGFNHN